MIIEASFFKLLHIWSAQERTRLYRNVRLIEEHSRDFFEAQGASEFANVITNELSSVGIDIPERLVIQGYPYPDNSRKHVDIYVNLEEYIRKAKIHKAYMSRNNYIEVKLFSGKDDTRGTQTITENIGYIINDILRMSLLTNRTPSRDEGISRYLLVLFDSHPENYIAYRRRDRKIRTWIEDLLLPLDFLQKLRKQKKGELPELTEMPVFNSSGTLRINLSDVNNVPNSMFSALQDGLNDKISRRSQLNIPYIKYCMFPFIGTNQSYFFLFRFFEITVSKAKSEED